MFIYQSGKATYQIANSLRFRSGGSAYLSRTFAGTPTTFTLSFWVKRGTLGTTQRIFGARSAGTIANSISFTTGDILQTFSSQQALTLDTTAVYRDPSAWYHFVVSTTTGNTTVYCNGAQVATSTTAFRLFNSAAAGNSIGRDGDLTSSLFEGYLADVNFIDGQALTPSSFGRADANGVWTPKKYTGTYGTNGFYLLFNDGSSTTNLCLDRSGNGNNWTPSGVSVTAGATYDWMVDTPTNNYCTLNPLHSFSGVAAEANLMVYYANTTLWATTGASIAVSTGKWYWETTHSNLIHTSSETMVGILSSGALGAHLMGNNTFVGNPSGGYGYYSGDGNKYNNGTGVAYGSALANGDVIGIALDADAGTLTFYKNNVSLGVAYSGLTGPYMPATSSRSGVVYSNFGQRPFTYTPPTGFKALCSANLPPVKITDPKYHFGITTYSGDNVSGRTITDAANIKFTPDSVWVKQKNGTGSNIFYDVGSPGNTIVNGTGARLAASAIPSGGLTAVVPSGFTVGVGSTDINNVNGTGGTYVAWAFRANGNGVTNNDGSITSTVSANTRSGYSYVLFTGTSTAGVTVGHGLGVAPKLIIMKLAASGNNWSVAHSDLTGPTYSINLNTSSGQSAGGTTIWGAAPTSTVFTVGTASTGASMAHCFADTPGFSKVFMFNSNASADGPFVYLGFTPAFILYKDASDIGTNWVLYDTARNTYNVGVNWLLSNQALAEQTTGAIDILSNGFKLRSGVAAVSDLNGTAGIKYIGVAFAAYPFGGSNVAPATAR